MLDIIRNVEAIPALHTQNIGLGSDRKRFPSDWSNRGQGSKSGRRIDSRTVGTLQSTTPVPCPNQMIARFKEKKVKLHLSAISVHVFAENKIFQGAIFRDRVRTLSDLVSGIRYLTQKR